MSVREGEKIYSRPRLDFERLCPKSEGANKLVEPR